MFFINNIFRLDIYINLDFYSDIEVFKEVINKIFGFFVKEEFKVWKEMKDIMRLNYFFIVFILFFNI